MLLLFRVGYLFVFVYDVFVLYFLSCLESIWSCLCIIHVVSDQGS